MKPEELQKIDRLYKELKPLARKLEKETSSLEKKLDAAYAKSDSTPGIKELRKKLEAQIEQNDKIIHRLSWITS